MAKQFKMGGKDAFESMMDQLLWVKDTLAGQVSGSMALEGLDLTDEDLQRIHQLAEDPTLEQSLLQELVKKHTNIKLQEE